MSLYSCPLDKLSIVSACCQDGKMGDIVSDHMFCSRACDSCSFPSTTQTSPLARLGFTLLLLLSINQFVNQNPNFLFCTMICNSFGKVLTNHVNSCLRGHGQAWTSMDKNGQEWTRMALLRINLLKSCEVVLIKDCEKPMSSLFDECNQIFMTDFFCWKYKKTLFLG